MKAFLRYVTIAVVAVLILFFLPLPVLVFGPGAAVDLNDLVSVPHHTSPPGKLYLTDVIVMPGRPAFYVAGKLLPGFEVVSRERYAGNSSDSQFDRELVDAMRESQAVAQIVAERAAGLNVKTKTMTTISAVNRTMPAAHCFKTGDVVVSVDGHASSTADVVPALTRTKPVGSVFHFTIGRDGKRMAIACRTAMYQGKARFGIVISEDTRAIELPVHVAYHVKGINGSSGGLMFALQIYRTLTGRTLAGGKDIAGTGVLRADGRVLPVGGAKEKLQAAISKGAAVFLVPTTDYPSIVNTPGIKILAVGSFDEALKKLQSI